VWEAVGVESREVGRDIESEEVIDLLRRQ